ncbi:polysaccharide pyruvyl transferase family protein [Cohnella sp. GCM10027633]|uniref:polysaccharide pyruvyl transferase family protein n=1 Tax=unclassified Cohnella TaxID=2636738 RepID=UPI003643CBF8
MANKGINRASNVRRIVLSGYYGFHNSGDEAVLKSILTALDEAGTAAGLKIEPIVLSGDPEWTRRHYGVEAVPRMDLREVRRALKNSDGLISGGGSLLQDATGMGSIPYYLGIMAIARWCGKPTFVYAQGIGPVNRKLFQPFIARAFKKAAYVSVRDEESALLLRRYGVPEAKVEVVPDPVMGLPAGSAGVEEQEARGAVGQEHGMMAGAAEGQEHGAIAGAEPAAIGGGVAGRDEPPIVEAGVAGGQEQWASAVAEPSAAGGGVAGRDEPPIVGVSVRFWRSDRADLDRAAAALEALAARAPRGVRLRFLPFHQGGDEGASRYVMERLSCAAELAPAHEDPQRMLREVGRCALLIGMRLHSLIYAANREVPLLGISYDPKIDQFLARLSQRAIGTTEALDPDNAADRALEIINNPAQWLAACGPAVSRLKREAIKPAQQIVDYLRI